MIPINQLKPRYLVIVVLIIAILIGAFFWWFLSFRLVSTNPKYEVSTSISQIEFKFSKDISLETLKNISTIPAVNGAYSVNKKSIIFKPIDPLKTGKLTFTFSKVVASNGDELKALSARFNVGYVEFKDLSDDEIKRQVDKSSGGQNRFDLLNGSLPHAEYNYTLDYIESSVSDEKLSLVIDTYGKATNESTEVYEARMEQARTDVIDYINQNKGKNSLDDFLFTFNDPYLAKYTTAEPEHD